MSIRLISAVRDLKLPPPEKFCLLAYADFANEEGGNAYPSRQKLADYTCYSERTVVSAVRSLEEKGFLTVTGFQGNGVRVYQISLEMLGLDHPSKSIEKPVKALKRRSGRDASAAPQVRSEMRELHLKDTGVAPDRVKEIHPKGAGAAPDPLINRQLDMSINQKELTSSYDADSIFAESQKEEGTLFDLPLRKKLGNLGIWPTVIRSMEKIAVRDGWTLEELHAVADQLIRDKGLQSAGQLFTYRIKNKIKPTKPRNRQNTELEKWKSFARLIKNGQLTVGLQEKDVA